MPESAADQGEGILDGADDETADDQRVERAQRKPAGQVGRLGVGVNWIAEENDEALAQIDQDKGGFFVGDE